MFLNQIEAFANVVKYKSFSMAAKVMFISQPSVSTYIKTLEKELNVQLLNRNSKNIVPTEAGRLFYDYATEILHLCDISKLAIQNFTQENYDNVSISTSPLFPQNLLADILVSFSKSYPNISCHVTQCDETLTAYNLEWFKSDLGITDYAIESQNLVCEPFYYDPIVLITPNTDRYPAGSEPFPISTLLSESFIVHSQSDSIHVAAMKFLSHFGIEEKNLKVTMRLPTTSSILHTVCIGNGIAFVCKESALDFIKMGYIRMFQFNSPVLRQTLYLISRNGVPLSAAASLLADHIRSLYQPSGNQNLVPSD